VSEGVRPTAGGRVDARPLSSLLRWMAKIAVSAVLLGLLLHKISIRELADLVRGMDRGRMISAAGVFVVSNVAGWLQWHVLLRASGVDLSRRRTFGFYNVGLFFNNFLPANIGGDAVKVYDVTREGTSVYQVIAVTLMDRLLGVFSLCLLAALADMVLIASSPGHYGLFLAVFVACMIPALGLYFFRPLGNALRRIVMRVRPLAIDRRMTSIIDHLSPFKGRRRLVAELTVFSLGIQTLRVLTHVLVGTALGVTVDRTVLLQLFVYVPLLSLAMIPPVTINGLGVREWLGVLLFARAGIASADAFAMEFITYLISVLASLIGLGFFLARRGGHRSEGAFRA
jgi:uncharacterized protein (TIRG00374 family)